MSKRHYIIPIFVPHEGCPHNCIFCNQNSITGNHEIIDDKYTENTITQYLKTIDAGNSTIEVSFFGGTFTAIPMQKQNLLLSVAKKYKELKKINYIRLSTRPDYIDDNILSNLKAYSVDIIELGVQSMDSEVLFKAARGHNKEDVVRASELIREYGFVLGHQVMLGLPGDTEQKDITTVKELIKLKPNIFRVYPSLVIKDTPMEKMYVNRGYEPYTLQEAVSVSKEIYKLLAYNNIKLIRMGLQTTENINDGRDVIAGPFHPAFRELVEGSLYNEMLLYYFSDKSGSLEIRINEKDISKLYANKKEFFNDTKKQLKTINIKVSIDNTVDRYECKAMLGEKCYMLSIKDYINNIAKEGKLNNS